MTYDLQVIAHTCCATSPTSVNLVLVLEHPHEKPMQVVCMFHSLQGRYEMGAVWHITHNGDLQTESCVFLKWRAVCGFLEMHVYGAVTEPGRAESSGLQVQSSLGGVELASEGPMSSYGLEVLVASDGGPLVLVLSWGHVRRVDLDGCREVGRIGDPCALTDCRAKLGVQYVGDRVTDSPSGRHPAQPTSIAVAATCHTTTHRRPLFSPQLMPAGRIVHDWESPKNATNLPRSKVRPLSRTSHLCAGSTSPRELARKGTLTLSLYGVYPSRAGSGRLDHIAPSSRRGGGGGVHKVFTPTLELPWNGPQREQSNESMCTAESSGDNTTSSKGQMDAALCDLRDLGRLGGRLGRCSKPPELVRLTECIQDHSLGGSLVLSCCIVGRDATGHPNDTSSSNHNTTAGMYGGCDSCVHDSLVQSGHSDESWQVWVAGVYTLLAFALGTPLCGLLAHLVVVVVAVLTGGILGLAHISSLSQHLGWVGAALALAVQLAAALLYIYCGKHITRLVRLASGLPLHARLGKRTIVIVDTLTVQLLESFVSKLYSQSYSVLSVEVHGASGLDHFLYRFQHAGWVAALAVQLAAALYLDCDRLTRPLADGRPHARLGKPTAVRVDSSTVHRRTDLLDREAVHTSNVCRPVATGLSFPRTSTGPMIAHRRNRAYAAAAVLPWALPPAPADSSGLQDPSGAARPPRQRRPPAVSCVAMREPVPWKMAWLLALVLDLSQPCAATSFTPRTITTAANGAYSVFAIDLDGDGDIDVLSASQFDDKIAWYENNGSQVFTPHTITTAADYARFVFAIDVDGDGDIDVL
ncbi:hypothetical protein B484DRAFT_394591, partial [Ochromonadaceae sp. CCMP2298]